MKDYVLNKKPQPVDLVWAIDLGHPLRRERGFLRSREREKVAQPDEGRQGKTIQGEVSNPGHQKPAARRSNEFGASLLIPAEFAETKTAAGRRRMWRTRQAHKAREQWLTDDRRVRWPAPRRGTIPCAGRRSGPSR